MTGTFTKTILFLSVLFAAADGSSHEHWLELSDFRPEAGATVGVSLCSGHHYPESSFSVREEVLRSFLHTGPDGTLSEIGLSRSGRKWTGEFKVGGAGVHVLQLVMQRDRAAAPAYEVRAIFLAGGEGDDPSAYGTGRGMEIVPAAALSNVGTGGVLPVFLLVEGEKTGAVIHVFMEDGESFEVKAGATEPAGIPIVSPGKYLLSASVAGRGCSLVFRIDDGGTGR